MKAIIIKEYGDINQLIETEIPKPQALSGEVVVKIKAFGINRAEIYMRQGAWGDVAKVSGIECVGLIEHDPSDTYAKGQKVIALMGGMGRTINGSYAQYTCLPIQNVIAVSTSLNWQDLAAIPESYATAWSCLHENLNLKKNQTILIRGGTSSLALAAINIAANIDGVKVIASTRDINNAEMLTLNGCDTVVIEDQNLNEQIRQSYPDGIDCVLDIVGNTTLLDSMKMVKKSGTVCNAGFLGGGEPFLFNPLMDMPPSVNLNFFASFLFGTKNFPLDTIPFHEIVSAVQNGIYRAKPVKTFAFSQIQQAHQLMEQNQAKGKIVVVLE